MKKYLLPYNIDGYKANLHCHTTVSDGSCTPQQVKDFYMERGYSVVAYTDHNVLVSHPELNDKNFLALNGLEYDVTQEAREGLPFRKTCHFCAIALEQDNLTQPCWHRSKYLTRGAVEHRDSVLHDENQPDWERIYTPEEISRMMKEVASKGFFVTYNHPTWSLEQYPEYMNYEGMHAIEMFNGACIVEGFDDYNPRVYDDMLFGGKRIYGIGADDNHLRYTEGAYCDGGHAFTVIKADKLEYRAVTKALEDGMFYASEGPVIHNLWFEDGKVVIETSPVVRMYANYGYRVAKPINAEAGEYVTRAEFPWDEKYQWMRVTIVDEHGKRACTNAYFPDQLKEEE